jgi:hypothetical protein
MSVETIGLIQERTMNDKAVFDRIDVLLNNVASSIEQIGFALLTLRGDPQLLKDLQNPEHPINRIQMTTQSIRAYMSGRWRRRDGDNFGIVPAATSEPHDADHPPGDLRPPDQR